MAYINLNPYIQCSVVAREFPKLASKYYGPYNILDKIGKCAYKLDLPASSTIHPTLHMSMLKFALSTEQEAISLSPSTFLTSWLKPLAILYERSAKRANVAITQWLMHWSNS